MNFLDPATISSLLCGLIAMLDSLRALAGFTSKVTCVFDIIFSSYSSSNFRVIPLYLICTAITIQKKASWLDGFERLVSASRRWRRRAALKMTNAEGNFFFHITETPEIYTLSLHDALPI